MTCRIRGEILDCDVWKFGVSSVGPSIVTHNKIMSTLTTSSGVHVCEKFVP